MSKLAALGACLTVATAGCGDRSGGPASPTSDASMGVDTGVFADGGGVDARPPPADGAVIPTDSGSSSCEPTPGTDTSSAYCDGFELALLDDGSGNFEARLEGRLDPDRLEDDSCATVDSVEVQMGGETIATYPGVGMLANTSLAPLAVGAATPEMVERCDSDTGRFGGFGFIVRGHVDGGTYEARCADAEGGGRWPPALRVTCHENVDRQPFYSNYATVDEFGGGLTYTTIDITMPHGPGGALLTIDDTIRVIPEAYSFGGGFAPAPFDVSALGTSVFETEAPAPGTYTSVSLSKMGDPLGPELCPVPMADPDPFADPSPVMLVRFTGTGERGAFSSEAFVDMCTHIPAPP